MLFNQCLPYGKVLGIFCLFLRTHSLPSSSPHRGPGGCSLWIASPGLQDPCSPGWCCPIGGRSRRWRRKGREVEAGVWGVGGCFLQAPLLQQSFVSGSP